MPEPRRFAMGISYGWYYVSYSDELARGAVRPLHYFGRDLVLFRDRNGTPGLLDAYCPHLGAHLGYGGHVDSDTLRCPFHGWAFRRDGFCANIPYSKTMPPAVQRKPVTQSYPVSEINGILWAWYHPRGAAPLFEVDECPELDEAGWAAPVRRLWRFASNSQEISENGVDYAHLKFVHGLVAVPEGTTIYEGHVRCSTTQGERRMTLANGESWSVLSTATIVQNGPGQRIIRLKDVVDVTMLSMSTPIEADDLELRYCFVHRDFEPNSAEYQAARAIIEGTCGPAGIEGDIPIWSHKIYRARPLLCDGDGPILRFRSYFQQFYADAPETREPFVAAAGERRTKSSRRRQS